MTAALLFCLKHGSTTQISKECSCTRILSWTLTVHIVRQVTKKQQQFQIKLIYYVSINWIHWLGNVRLQTVIIVSTAASICEPMFCMRWSLSTNQSAPQRLASWTSPQDRKERERLSSVDATKRLLADKPDEVTFGHIQCVAVQLW